MDGLKRIINFATVFALACFVGIMNISFPSVAAANTGMAFNAPLNYFYTFDEDKTINIVISTSTTTLQKGTILTISGLPTDAANWATYNELYSVEISQSYFGNYNHENQKSYGGESGVIYNNGTVVYTLTSDSPVEIIFGGWAGDLEGGLDESYTISTNGVLAGSGLGTYFDEFGTVVTFDEEEEYENYHLSKFVLNSSDFNALSYYLNNPDLQTSIGANPQDLYNHWITVGKSEGRKAI